MRRVMVGVGIIALLLGALWLLQGTNILPGSVMTGQSFWAMMGAILIVVGAVLCFFGLRRKAANPPA